MVTLSVGDILIGAGLMVTFGSVMYFMGRLAARVEALEAWRAQMTATLDGIYSSLRHIEATSARESV